MDESYKATPHSFLVRIWLEVLDVDQSGWRGHITHVGDGTRLYVENLGEINAFISKYLAD